MQKKVPLRMCVSCKEMKDKKNLIRIVKNKENQIFVDPTFKANGRGAYLCNSIECLEKSIKTKALNRAFKCEINEEVVENIKKYIQK